MSSNPLTKAKHKKTLPNGRSDKGVPKADNWFAMIYIHGHVVSPAWRSLSKTATDMAIIIKAKFSKAAAYNQKDNGKPIFNFTVSEAVRLLGISRPTCTRAFNELKDKGFIEVIDPGGILDGKGRSAIFTWSSRWREWTAPPRDNSNILKARSMRQKPGSNKQCKTAAVTG